MALMDTLIIKRTETIGKAVCGDLNLYANGTIHILGCKTLENVDYLISEGEYEGCLSPSLKFHRKLPFIMVPGRTGIMIHQGNRYINSRGCVLVGNSCVHGVLYNSRYTINRLMEHLPVKFKVIVTS